MKILTKSDKPEVTNVSQFGLHWPELDADIELEALKNPKNTHYSIWHKSIY